MKNLAKGFAALLICGTFVFANCDTAEAAEIADLNSDTVQTQELARHHYPPPPPPPPHRPGHWDRHPHHPPPPPPHHRPGHHPPHFDRHPHHPPPPPPHRNRW